MSYQPVESTAPRNRANRYAHIDAMRAVAVLLVVVGHAGLGEIVPGGSGVTIFFAISGFIITYLVLREHDRTGHFRIGRFYFRRAMKLFPPLLLIIIIPTLVFAAFNPIDWRAVLAQIGFVFNWYKVVGGADVLPGSGVVWSLAIEEQFYLAFAVLWLALSRFRRYHQWLIVASVVAISYSTLSRLIITLHDAADAAARIYYSTDTRLDSIAWGVLTATLLHLWNARGSRTTRAVRVLSGPSTIYVALALFVLSLIIRDEVFRDTFRFTLQSIAACLIIVFGLLPGSGATRRSIFWVSTLPVISGLGLASYSIYLVHLPLMSLLFPFTQDWPRTLSVSLLSALGVAAGYAIYRVVEIPVLRARGALEARYFNRTVVGQKETPDQRG
jgi:peptidoglycan/LPS O-acetylase OafA/YrhL